MKHSLNTLSHRKWMMSNHGIHSVSIDKVLIQILVILIFANINFHKYIWYLLTLKKPKWNEWFFYFHFNCQCQISWNHDFWLSFIQSLSVTLHLWSLYLWLYICDSTSVISSSVTLHLWSLHLWLFICDLFICDYIWILLFIPYGIFQVWYLLCFQCNVPSHRWKIKAQMKRSQMKRSQM
jgi:hypothetical protein